MLNAIRSVLERLACAAIGTEAIVRVLRLRLAIIGRSIFAVSSYEALIGDRGTIAMECALLLEIGCTGGAVQAT